MTKSIESKKIIIPPNYNYIALFLTLACNLKCPYCINLNESGSSRAKVSHRANAALKVEQWLSFINRLEMLDENGAQRQDLPLTLQGGEPSLYSGFYELINGIPAHFKLDLLTNFLFDIDEFIKKVPVQKFTRDAKYAAIRVSYHPGQNEIKDLIARHHKMRDAGFYVGIYSVATPQNAAHIAEVAKICEKEKIDFRTKEYLGFDGLKWHGSYKYDGAISQKCEKYCECKTTELICAPDGSIFRCHSDLYENRTPIGNITNPSFELEDKYRACFVFGHCNPCDIKVKTNRFQEFGHTSVDIKNIRELSSSERAALSQGNFGL